MSGIHSINRAQPECERVIWGAEINRGVGQPAEVDSMKTWEVRSERGTLGSSNISGLNLQDSLFWKI